MTPSAYPQGLVPIRAGVKLIFNGGHISFEVAFKGLNVILGLYKCNYSLTRGKELYIQLFEGNHEVDVALGENEFDNSVLEIKNHLFNE